MDVWEVQGSIGLGSLLVMPSERSLYINLVLLGTSFSSSSKKRRPLRSSRQLFIRFQLTSAMYVRTYTARLWRQTSIHDALTPPSIDQRQPHKSTAERNVIGQSRRVLLPFWLLRGRRCQQGSLLESLPWTAGEGCMSNVYDGRNRSRNMDVWIFQIALCWPWQLQYANVLYHFSLDINSPWLPQ